MNWIQKLFKPKERKPEKPIKTCGCKDVDLYDVEIWPNAPGEPIKVRQLCRKHIAIEAEKGHLMMML